MISIVIEKVKQKILKIQLSKVNAVAFTVLLIMICGLLSYLWLNKTTSVYKTRQNNPYIKVEGYKYSEIENKSSLGFPIKQYEWNLGNVTENIDCISFFTIYEYVNVYIGDELVYSLSPNDNELVSVIGHNWTMIPLKARDSYKEIRIEVTPINTIGQNSEIEFMMGERMQIITYVFEHDLPCIVLGLISAAIGIIFCSISLIYVLREKRNIKKNVNLIYIGILSLITGVWRIMDTKICVIAFPYNHAATGLSVIYADMLLGIPAILFVRISLEKKYFILDVLCAINIINAFMMSILQAFYVPNIVQNIIITNIILLVSVVTFMVLSIKEIMSEKHDKKRMTRLICIIICCTSAIIDIILYYVRQTSVDLVVTAATFIVYFIILGVMTVCELNDRAERDLHTGLYNKSECLSKIRSQSILAPNTVLFMFDLNNLKKVNDTYGHEYGDKLILDFAHMILENVPMRAFAGRFGGDEFIVIMNRADKYRIKQIINGMQRSTEKYNKDSQKIQMSYAYGYALSNDFEQCTMQMLMDKADYEMYLDKREYHKTHPY